MNETGEGCREAGVFQIIFNMLVYKVSRKHILQLLILNLMRYLRRIYHVNRKNSALQF